MSSLPDPTERVPEEQDWPCGCMTESEGRHIRPCEMHQEIRDEAKLWETLEAMFPDYELPEADPRDFDPNQDGA